MHNSTEFCIIGKPTLDALGFQSDRYSIELGALDLRFPTQLPGRLPEGDACFLHLADNYVLTGANYKTEQHRMELAIPRQAREGKGEFWIEQGPDCPGGITAIEGPVPPLEGKPS